MAVVFELVVNFGTDMEAARAAAGLVRRADPISVRGVLKVSGAWARMR